VYWTYQTFTHNIASARGKKKTRKNVILRFSTAAVAELTVTHGNQYLRLPSLWPSSIIASPSCSIRKSYTSARLKSDNFHKPMSTGMHGCNYVSTWMTPTNCKDRLWIHHHETCINNNRYLFPLAQKRSIQDAVVIRKLRKQYYLQQSFKGINCTPSRPWEFPFDLFYRDIALSLQSNDVISREEPNKKFKASNLLLFTNIYSCYKWAFVCQHDNWHCFYNVLTSNITSTNLS